MIENLPAILRSIGSTTSALEAFSNWQASTIGDARSLIEELKENSRYCWLILEEDVGLKKMIPALSTSEYDRINKTGFDFNTLNRKKIRKYPSLEGTDLSSWRGRTTYALVSNIYDKIKDLKTKYRYAAKSKRILWKKRVENIQRRILLLLIHVGS